MDRQQILFKGYMAGYMEKTAGPDLNLFEKQKKTQIDQLHDNAVAMKNRSMKNEIKPVKPKPVNSQIAANNNTVTSNNNIDSESTPSFKPMPIVPNKPGETGTRQKVVFANNKVPISKQFEAKDKKLAEANKNNGWVKLPSGAYVKYGSKEHKAAMGAINKQKVINNQNNAKPANLWPDKRRNIVANDSTNFRSATAGPGVKRQPPNIVGEKRTWTPYKD